MLRHSRIALHVQQHVINRARNDFRNGRSEQQNVTFISKHLDEKVIRVKMMANRIFL
jgi:hypothetical protein